MRGEIKIRFWLIGLAVFFILLYLLRGVLLPFVAGMAVAYFLDPLADRLERSGASRLAATVLITVTFFFVVVMVLIFLVPAVEHEVVSFAGRIPAYAESLVSRVAPLVRNLERYLSAEDVERIRTAVGDYAGTAIGWLANLLKALLSGAGALFNVLSLIFITPVVAFYLLRDWDRLVGTVDGWLPRRHAETVREQFREIDRTLSGFVRGQATVCIILGIFYAAGLSLLGLELGLVVGLLAGLVSFIPYLGSIFGFVVSVGLALAQSPDWTLPGLVAGLFLVGQAIEGNFLTPKLVGERVGLHPVWVIFALLAGGSLFGFVGVLMAVPVAAVIGVLTRFGLRRYLSSPLYDDSTRTNP